jgi:hypothetical protein
MRRWPLVAAITITALVVLLTKGQGTTMPLNTDAASAVEAEELSAAARTKVFFGHQSVGRNVLDGLGGLYAAHGLTAPSSWSDAYIGENGDPLGKIDDFEARIREGAGAEADVALMKLCYVDVTDGTDVDAVFERYRATLADLERDFPDVRFLHVTAPLTTEAGLVSRLKAGVKSLLGRDVVESRADNVARERFNAMMREEYGPGRLFDLAGVESTAPDGTRVSGDVDGQDYFALHSGYAADSGHLDQAASMLAAAHLVALVAGPAGR